MKRGSEHTPRRMSASDQVARGVAAACAGERPLLPPGAAVLVACSGGADSSALAAALVAHQRARPELRLSVSLGHVDHGLRADSPADAALVRALAGRLGVPFHSARLQGLGAALGGQGLEGAAREARYEALSKLASAAGAGYVATAHTRRDQAETLILRLARGAGPGALAGARARRPLADGITLVRPLLAVPRAATEALCAELGLEVARDPHNEDRARARTRVRALLPQLAAELNPRLEEALASAAELFADEDDLLASLALTALHQAQDSHGGLVAARLAALHPALARRSLLAAATRAGCRPERAHLEEIRSAILSRGGRPAWELHVPRGVARLEQGILRFEDSSPRGAAPEPPLEVAILGPGRYDWSGRLLVVSEGSGKGTLVDEERAPFPWTLRSHRKGDRFRPGNGRTRKVSDQWIDARVPRSQRARLPLLTDAAGIVFWVEGLREGFAMAGRMARPIAFEWTSEMAQVPGELITVLR